MRKLILGLLLLFCFAFAQGVPARAQSGGANQIATTTKEGVQYVSARAMASVLRGTVYWYSKSERMVVQLRRTKVQFEAGQKTARINSDKVTMTAPAYMQGDRLMVPLDFFTSKDFTSAIDASLLIKIEDLNTVQSAGTAPAQSVLPSSTQMPPGPAKRTTPFKAPSTGPIEELGIEEEEEHVISLVPGGNDKRSSKKGTSSRRRAPAKNTRASSKGKTQLTATEEAVAATVITAPAPVSTAQQRKLIVVDAGHGGKDPGGKKRCGLSEKEINLKIALELEDKIEKENYFDVLLTRKADTFLSLSERSEIANKNKASIFISIHANAHSGSAQNGFEIFFMSEDASDPWAAEVAKAENAGEIESMMEQDPLLYVLGRNSDLNEGAILAGLIAKEMHTRTIFVNRGVKQAPFYVLRGTYAPSVLVESGYMTSPKDCKNLSVKRNQEKIAEAIYEGIKQYAKLKGWTMEKTKR